MNNEKISQSSSDTPEQTDKWQSLSDDFTGEKNINDKTGKPRTFTEFDLYPRQPGETSRQYGDRLKFMHQKIAEYEAAEQAKAEAEKTQPEAEPEATKDITDENGMRTKSYLESDYGQEELKAEAKFDRISSKLDALVEKKIITRERADALLERQLQNFDREVDAIRQGYEDSQAVATPEDEAAYERWQNKIQPVENPVETKKETQNIKAEEETAPAFADGGLSYVYTIENRDTDLGSNSAMQFVNTEPDKTEPGNESPRSAYEEASALVGVDGKTEEKKLAVENLGTEIEQWDTEIADLERQLRAHGWSGDTPSQAQSGPSFIRSEASSNTPSLEEARQYIITNGIGGENGASILLEDLPLNYETSIKYANYWNKLSPQQQDKVKEYLENNDDPSSLLYSKSFKKWLEDWLDNQERIKIYSAA